MLSEQNLFDNFKHVQATVPQRRQLSSFFDFLITYNLQVLSLIQKEEHPCQLNLSNRTRVISKKLNKLPALSK